MRTITRGCGFDDETKEWAIWMNKPNGLSLPDRTLYYHGTECKFQNYTNKKGIAMFVLRGKLTGNVTNINSFFIQMRADFQKYIEDKKKKMGRPGQQKVHIPPMHPYWVKDKS